MLNSVFFRIKSVEVSPEGKQPSYYLLLILTTIFTSLEFLVPLFVFDFTK